MNEAQHYATAMSMSGGGGLVACRCGWLRVLSLRQLEEAWDQHLMEVDA